MAKKNVKVNLGCGVHLVKGFINIDSGFTREELESKKGVWGSAIIDKGASFIKADMRNIPLDDNSVDYLECIDAIEHVPFREVELVIKEVHRILKRGGKAVFFTTDFDDIASVWVEYIKDKDFKPTNWFNMQNIIYGNQIHEGEFHKSAFNPRYWNGLVQACGFKKFKLVAYPRGALPPTFKSAQWNKAPMGVGMTLVELTK